MASSRPSGLNTTTSGNGNPAGRGPTYCLGQLAAACGAGGGSATRGARRMARPLARVADAYPDLARSGSHRSAALDDLTVLENHRIVVDDRVGGDSRPKMQEYECGTCHRAKWSEAAVPRCHGEEMSLKKKGVPRGISETRSQQEPGPAYPSS